MSVQDILDLSLDCIKLVVSNFSPLFIWLSACFVIFAIMLLIRSIFYNV